MSDTSANGAMPPDLEPVHRRLLADSAAWSTLLPSTERLRAHTQQLTRGYGNGAAGVAGVPARSPKMYAFGEEAMDDTQPETALVRTRIQPLATTHPSRIRGLLATVAAAVVVLLLAGTFYALSARPGGIGGQGPATPLPTPGPATGVGVPGPQARFVPSAVSAHDMDATGAPVRQGGSFYPGNVVYIIARVQGVQPGETHTLTIRWYVDGRRVDLNLPANSLSQTVTANGYVHFLLKLPTGAAEAKLYWDLPAADATGAEASLAQTVNFTVLPVPTVPPEPGITPTPAVSNPYIPSSTPSGSETPTPGGSATPTPSPALP